MGKEDYVKKVRSRPTLNEQMLGPGSEAQEGWQIKRANRFQRAGQKAMRSIFGEKTPRKIRVREIARNRRIKSPRGTSFDALMTLISMPAAKRASQGGGIAPKKLQGRNKPKGSRRKA